ncbi:FAD binding domain-containing protein [Colletotrichum salicis]|uniref:FAD binding domain-containing protein n=1 Tax=Colletotrichum salicis TaxID=1209931 RepID=A0A135UUL0_9PEZI|nr:FAD binding domain-containing protein [Colletotrichum salicis]
MYSNGLLTSCLLTGAAAAIGVPAAAAETPVDWHPRRSQLIEPVSASCAQAVSHADLSNPYPGSHTQQLTASSHSNQCAQLSTTFPPSRFHYPSNDTTFAIWDAKQQEVRPACRVEPTTASDVSLFLITLVDNWCHFAVKGGGHSRNAGDSNSIAGVTVDLDRMNSVEVVGNGTGTPTRASVGGGATVIQVYQALEGSKLSYVGGRSATVVLANGTITTASETHNQDLYFALRGGSNNFAIVTTFTVRVFPQDAVSSQRATYTTANQTESALDAIHDLFTDPALTGDMDMAYDFYYLYNQVSGAFSLMESEWYANPAVAEPEVFEAIRGVPATTRTARLGSMANLTGTLQPPVLGTTRHLFGTISTLPSRALLTQALAIFREEVSAISAVEGLAPNLICYPLSTTAIQAMRQRGGNALGIDQDEPLYSNLPRLNSLVQRRRRRSCRANDGKRPSHMESFVQESEIEHPHLYINYASSAQTSKIFAGYGEENVRHLKAVAREVDPQGVFSSEGLWRGFVKLL